MPSQPRRIATPLIAADARGIEEAANLLRDGKLVAFPTETVYGLGANALDDFAVSSIFAAKGRPRFNPLIVHVHDREEADELVRFNPTASKLADTFWPGPLTLVLPRREPSPLALLISSGLPNVAVRAPSNPIARALIEAACVPIAAPSANRSGRLTPTKATDVVAELGGCIDLILDGGPCQVGIESTIVGFMGNTPVLLRPGGVPRETIEAIAGPLGNPIGDTVEAPGMMASHYAPRAKLRLNAAEVRPGEALLAFGSPNATSGLGTCNLSPTGNLQEAAANLFSMLRVLDKTADAIAVMPIPTHGLGEAINDRLARAAVRD